MHKTWEAIAVQRRVWGALFMREIQTRWGRRNLGFAWLFAEPLVFAFPILAMWSYIRPSLDRGIPIIAFTWSGYLPLLVFRHVTGGALFVVRTNSALLYHRAITPLDLFVGRCVLQAAGEFAAVFFSYVVLYVCGFLDWPDDVPLMLAGTLYMTWWALAVALVVAAMSERFEYFEHLWSPIAYMYMAVCGFMFLADWLPPTLRGVALAIDPPLHAYEMIRAGLFGHLVRTYADAAYLTYTLAGLTFVGLWLMRDIRQYIEIT
jgi:capsular polysaccharide transport system permease protein